VSISGAGSRFESTPGNIPLMGVDAAAKPNTVRQVPSDAAAAVERPSAGDQRLPALLVLLTLGVAATGVSLVIAALLVRMFADGQGGTTKLLLVGAGTVVGTFAAGLLGEPVVTRAQKAFAQRAVGED